MKRPLMYRARDLPHAVSLALSFRGVRCLIIDLEMTVVPCGSPGETAAEGIRSLVVQLAGSSRLASVLVVSNAQYDFQVADHGFLSVGFLPNARKPWGARKRVNAFVRDAGGTAVVIGDQVLTDGLLARSLGYRFIQTRLDCPEPLWPKMQRRLGSIVGRLLFSRAT